MTQKTPETQKSQKTQSTQTPASKPVAGPPQTLPHPQTRPVEPVEVLGRHKNTGQKDHKGAR